MNYKLQIAINLRAGLKAIKQMYRLHALADSPFQYQWQLLRLKEWADIDFDTHTKVKEDQFAWSSRRLLHRILKGG